MAPSANGGGVSAIIRLAQLHMTKVYAPSPITACKRIASTTPLFTYLGHPRFVSWEGEAPITIEWELPAPIPAALHRAFGVA